MRCKRRIHWRGKQSILIEAKRLTNRGNIVVEGRSGDWWRGEGPSAPRLVKFKWRQSPLPPNPDCGHNATASDARRVITSAPLRFESTWLTLLGKWEVGRQYFKLWKTNKQWRAPSYPEIFQFYCPVNYWGSSFLDNKNYLIGPFQARNYFKDLSLATKRLGTWF